MSERRALDASRRDFLARMAGVAGAVGSASALGASIAADTPARASVAPAKQTDYDVIVVGGGFSGVTAARDCRKSGLSTLLLEARARLGGRTFDTEWNGHHVELGGTWVHWIQPYTWAEIHRYGLDIFETPGANAERLIVRGDDFFLDTPYAKVAAEIAAAGNEYFADARALWERPWDAHFSWDKLAARDSLTTLGRLSQLKLSKLQRLVLEALMEVCTHSPIGQGSYLEIARWYALGGWEWGLFNDSIGRYQIKQGTGELLRRMAADGKPDVKLSSPVRRIEQRADVAIVTAQDGAAYSAKAVILALPMNCLADIEYAPALAAGKIAASRARHTGVGVKFFAEVKGRLGKVLLLAPVKYGAGDTFTYEELPDSTLLVGFGSDPDAFDPNDAASVQRVLRQFIPDVEVMSCMSYSWVRDPFALGTYCSYPPGTLTRWLDELGRREGRLYMAGSDVSEGWRGFIDGAIGRGAQIADQVARELVGD